MSRTEGGAYQSGGKPVEQLKPPPKGSGLGATDHLVCHADIDRLLTEVRYLREALILARQVIDPEQHDVIEEIDMALAYRVERTKVR